MTIERRDDVPKPSYLPPNPSVGELVTEIDRARHDAAHTLEALVEKLDVKARMKHETQQRKGSRHPIGNGANRNVMKRGSQHDGDAGEQKAGPEKR